VDHREALLRRAYEAFNSRDIEAALALMAPDVDWPNAMDDRRERGRGAVRAYWLRQFAVISPHVEPERFSIDEEGRIVVDVHQVVRDIAGGFLADRHAQHVYALRGGKIARMDIVEP
jgi:hypothetical protein